MNRSKSGIRKFAIIYILMTAPLASSFGADSIAAGISPLSLRVEPSVQIPFGSDAADFPFGAGASLSATYRLKSLPLVYVGGDLGYSFVSTNAPSTSLSLLALGAQAGLHFQLARALSARVYGSGGGFMVSMNEAGSEVQFNPYVGGGFNFSLDIARDWSLFAGAGYRQYFGLLGGLTAGLGVSYQLPIRSSGSTKSLPPDFTPLMGESRGLKLIGIKLDSVFPVFYKYYDDHQIGEAILRNYESVAAEDLKVFLEVKQYMDNPKECKVPLTVKAGDDGRIVLYGLFTDKILEVAEATKLSVNISVEYKQYGRSVKDSYIQTLSVLDRNALTWSDDQKAAAFISSKDPQALAFSKSVMVAIKDITRPGVSQNIQTAIALHQALLQDKIAYVDDPTSALTTNNKEIVDFIQYPQQTLGFRAGKCSDLTVLYCSLFESVGVATALITVPGHILMAFDLEMPESEARQVFFNPEDLIYMNGTTWLPIETTLRTGNFMDAWTEGIRQWRVGTQQKKTAFYPVREAWKLYNPIVFSGKTASIAIPEAKQVAKAFSNTLSSFIDRQMGVRVADLQRQIKSSNNPQIVNRLGLLYARFGQYDKAQEQFQAILEKGEQQYALINLGNIYYLKSNYSEALKYYNRALKKTPNDSRALLAVVKANVALEKYDTAKDTYDKLKSIDPELASRNAYLGSDSTQGLRAADAQKIKGDVSWQE